MESSRTLAEKRPKPKLHLDKKDFSLKLSFGQKGQIEIDGRVSSERKSYDDKDTILKSIKVDSVKVIKKTARLY